MDIRIGQGVDFHRLIHQPGRPLMLGGVRIEDELALEGHSDADVVLHAITDGILGALALGDLGVFFPDSDPAFKNADSALLLSRAMTEMGELGYKIGNVDVTIIGEKPRINPHRSQIQEKVAALLEIPKERTGIKATTTEKMGFLGRTEGLGCLVVLLLVASDAEK